MVKVDIVRAIQLEEGLSFGESESLINQLLEIIKDTLVEGEDVLISGFGKFELRRKNARPGRDPKTKKEYKISSRKGGRTLCKQGAGRSEKIERLPAPLATLVRGKHEKKAAWSSHILHPFFFDFNVLG